MQANPRFWRSRWQGVSIERSAQLAALAVAVAAIVIPLAVAHFPPMTDLPFHAAQSSALRHYFDPSFHLWEQFEFHLFLSPYLSLYVIAAGLMLVFPVMTAVKIAAAIMLALLPSGLAVLFSGMKKSPWLGLLSLGLCWGRLTHWGFLNFVGAIGLFALILGLTLRLVDQPSRGRQMGLFCALIALFFTHIFRFPFALIAVFGAAVVMYPATRRIRPVVAPLLPVLFLFIVWGWFRKAEVFSDSMPLAPHGARLAEFFPAIYGGFYDPAEKVAFIRYALVIGLVAAVGSANAAIDLYERRRCLSAWNVGVTALPIASALASFTLFLVLPMKVGEWWGVYPREATATAYLLLAACPDLPKAAWLRILLLVAMAASGLGIAQVVARNYASTNAAVADFVAITQTLPRAPKLCYLIYDHEGTTRTKSPFVHLPAYVQAEKGGWLSFHFASSNLSPLSYRRQGSPGAIVPPRTPPGWEWNPQSSQLETIAPFFDWFLVRKAATPAALFSAHPEIQEVEHIGTWWLYKRVRR